jgi:hypothetical protein
METILNLSNLFVMPFWLVMILLPHWRWTRRLMASLWPVGVLALAYTGLLLTQLGAAADGLLNPSLASIAGLLGTPSGATIGWVHFLAIDLFAGRWAYLDSRKRGLSAWLVSPALFFILMAGPLGLLLYLLARWAWEQTRRPQAGGDFNGGNL